MSVLNVPIQINGGTSVPTTSTLTLDRELYITSGKDLYVNTNSSVGKVNCGVSDSTRSLVNNNTSVFNFDSSRATFSIGYLNFASNTFTSTNNVSFSGVSYIDIPRMVLRNTMYGTSLPSSGTQGQIFFVLQ